MKVIKGIVHQPYEVKGSSVFYAFSYYFDRAVESGLIGEWAQTEMLLYLPVPLSFQLIIIFCTKSVFKLHVCLFFPAQKAVEVVHLKSGILRREPKKVRVTMMSSLGRDELVYETNNLTSYIYQSSNRSNFAQHSLNSKKHESLFVPDQLVQLHQIGTTDPLKKQCFSAFHWYLSGWLCDTCNVHVERTRFTVGASCCVTQSCLCCENTVTWTKPGSGRAGSWADDVCLAQAGGHLTATHHLGADTYPNTQTMYWAVRHRHPPAALCWPSAVLLTPPCLFSHTKTERSSFNHVAQRLERWLFFFVYTWNGRYLSARGMWTCVNVMSETLFFVCVCVCVCSVQQNDQIPRYQPLPLHGYDIYHLSAKRGLWLQGQHCAAGEQTRATKTPNRKSVTKKTPSYSVLNTVFFQSVEDKTKYRELLLCGGNEDAPVALLFNS